MILYAVRHPQTEWNLRRILQGHDDSPLTEFGRTIALKTGDILVDKNISSIHSSDLGRCKETTQIINDKLLLPIVYSEELRERDFGELSGKNKEEVLKVFDINDSSIRAPGGENMEEMKNRVINYVIKTLCKSKEEAVLIVTHCGGVESLLSHANDCNFEDIRCRNSQGEIHKFQISDDKINFVETIKVTI